MSDWSRRSFCAAMAAGTFGFRAQAQATQLPNIVYILADDLGWGDLRSYNPRSAIPTPHTDRMAAEGVRFVDMHSPSAVCTPTRYGILTGRYCWRSRLKNGVLWGYSPNLIEKGRLTVPGLLKQVGYHTAGIGKWHLGLGEKDPVDYSRPLRPGPLDHGFDSYFGIPASLDMPPYVYIENDHVVEAPTAMVRESTRPRGVFWRGGDIAPSFQIEEVLQTLTQRTIDHLRVRAKTPNQPFFLYLPLTAPHTPWTPGQEFRGRSKAGDYGDFVAHVDDVVGRVLQTLQETSLDHNTLVIFTSDNGANWTVEDRERYAHQANASWRGQKADIWEAGHRVPFIARWPAAIPAGTIWEDLGCLTDLFATVADLINRPLPRDAGEDSFSLLPALRGESRTPARSSVVHHSAQGIFSIREGHWKLILGLGSGGFSVPASVPRAPGGPEGQLFNLADDPGERYNLYQQYPEVVAKLSALLRKQQQQGHSRPLD
jgi:arylsulfatase A